MAGDLKKVQELLDQGVDVGFVDELGNNALHWSVRFKQVAIAKLLLKAFKKSKKRINSLCSDSLTILHVAAHRGNIEMLNDVLNAWVENGLKLDVTIPYGSMNVLHHAVNFGSREVIEALISAFIKTGTAIDKQSNDGSTALHFAVNLKHLEIAKLLIIATVKTGGNLDLQDCNGYTTLHYAAYNGFLEIVQLLLAHGAAFDLKVKTTSWTPRDYLIKANADYDANQLHAIIVLASVGCLFEKAEKDSKRTLEEIVTTLGSAINARSGQRNGNTALHIAIITQRIDMILGLLAAGANVNLKNKFGQTQLELMYHSPDPNIKALAYLCEIQNLIGKNYVKNQNELITTVAIEELQPFIYSIYDILPSLSNDKIKDHIYLTLGLWLARRTSKLYLGGLMPIDAVYVYNLLSKVRPQSDGYPLANTVLDILCFERHIRLEREFQAGPFFAVVTAPSKFEAALRQDMQTEQEQLLERAMFFHRSRSGPENPHKETANKLAAGLIDPGLSIQGIPGFTQFSELSSLHRFFDAAETAQEQRKALQKSSEAFAMQIAELEARLAGEKTQTNPVERSEAALLVFKGPTEDATPSAPQNLILANALGMVSAPLLIRFSQVPKLVNQTSHL
jgi:ankyrin repeat protein